jgi:carboxynorspermidine decarboxylase
MPYRPFVLGSALPGEKPHTYRLGGGTCLAGDIAGDYSFDTPLKIGDRLIFDDMIHYTMVKTTFFNGVKHPSIGIWDGQNFELCREFTYEQYKNHLG